MTREELFQWVKQEYGTEAEYPWKGSNAVLRRADNDKWYGVILSVAGSKLKGTVKELPSRDEIDVPVNEVLIVELYSK